MMTRTAAQLIDCFTEAGQMPDDPRPALGGCTNNFCWDNNRRVREKWARMTISWSKWFDQWKAHVSPPAAGWINRGRTWFSGFIVTLVRLLIVIRALIEVLIGVLIPETEAFRDWISIVVRLKVCAGINGRRWTFRKREIRLKKYIMIVCFTFWCFRTVHQISWLTDLFEKFKKKVFKLNNFQENFFAFHGTQKLRYFERWPVDGSEWFRFSPIDGRGEGATCFVGARGGTFECGNGHRKSWPSA